MKLKRLLHIQEGNIHIIGCLNPLFFYRLSDTMSDFIKNCSTKSYEDSLTAMKSKYPPQDFEKFEERLNTLKDKLFINDETIDYYEINLSQEISTLTLNTTRKCNLKCLYCFENEEYRKHGHMSFVVAKKAINTFFTNNLTK